MIEVIGVSFKEKGRIYYFLPGNLKLKKNITVIVETEKGQQFGKVVTDLIKVDKNNYKLPLKNVVRIASKKDFNQHMKNIEDSKIALKKCRDIVKKDNIDMNIIDASYTFDRDQLIFNFISDNRVDFRDLAKKLALLYKTRIELRQVGVRDKAKEINGYGSCGREFCCSKFLNDFDSVSINMAKNQGLALNPTKINGCCGRLLCCLKYENDTYTELGKDLPKVGKTITIEEGTGRVISVDTLNRKFKIDIKDKGVLEIKR